MGGQIIIRIGGPDAAIRFEQRRDDLGPALTKIGALMVAQGKRAFVEQRLGGTIWPERYPKQKEPFINIAPVVFKAGQGKAPGGDDFRRRPALGGVTSDLASSLAFSVSGKTVEVGSPFAWAGLFQFGGEGRIPITDTTRATLGQWLFGSGTTIASQKRALAKNAKAGGKYVKGTREQYARKLAFVFTRDELVQKTYARPFIGFTDDTLDDVTEILAEHFEGKVAA